MLKPNVVVRTAHDSGAFTDAQVRGMVCNPIYAGVPPYPGMMDDETWIAAAKRAIEEQGAEQFLVNMLYVLRESMKSVQ